MYVLRIHIYIYIYQYSCVYIYIHIVSICAHICVMFSDLLLYVVLFVLYLILASLSTTNLKTFGNQSTTRGYTSQERLRCTQVARLIGMGLFSCLLGVTSFTVVCHHDLFVHDLPLQQILNEISVRLSSSCEDFGSHLC